MIASSLYTDGGVIKRNPSLLGGTWAWVEVLDGQVLRRDSGVLLPADVGKITVTNNVTELYAIIQGLLAMGEEWKVTLISDSIISLNRISKRSSFKGVPDFMQQLCRRLRIVRERCRHVPGHTKKYGDHSRFNAECDTECTRLAKA